MAYTYTIFAAAGASIAPSAIPSGTVFQYAGNDFIFVNAYNSQATSNTSSMNFWLQNGFVTHIDGSTTAITDSDAAIYLRSGTNAITDSDKITEAVTKIATKIGEDRAVINRHTGEINALKDRATALEGRATAVEGVAASKAAIDDSTAGLTSTTTTLSGAKTSQLISDAELRAKNAAVEQIMGGATSAALDTIKELGDALTAVSGDGVAAINAALAKRVSIESQSFTSAEQAQARTNIGAVSTAEMTTAINNAVTAAVGDPTIVDIDALLSGLPAVA